MRIFEFFDFSGHDQRYLVDQFVDGSPPFDEDLVEASEATGVGHISRVRNCHFVTLQLFCSHAIVLKYLRKVLTGEPIICGLLWHCKLSFISVDSSEMV